MIWVVAIEAAVIVVLALMVVALVHSYGGLAAKVERLGGRATSARSPRAAGVDRAAARRPAAEHLVGTTPTGEDAVLALVGVAHDTLLAFLTSTCATCERFWRELAASPGGVVPPGVRLVVVAKGADRESPSSILALAPPDVDVVLSSEAWAAFEVPGSPYFVLVDGLAGTIAGEGTGLGWDQVLDLMGVSASDEVLRTASGPGAARRDLSREEDVDRLLLEAGLRPGDPSLYPPQPGEPK